MNNSLKIIFLLVLLLGGNLLSAEMPTSPKTLLDTLPKLGEPWKVTLSTAETSFPGWLLSEAKREFENGNTSQNVSISIVDTGGDEVATGRFANLQELEAPNIFRGNLDGRPTQILRTETTTNFSTLLDKRIIVTVLCEGFSQKDAKEWIGKNVPMTSFAQLPSSGKTELPAKVPIVFIDELHPEKNRSYTTARGHNDPDELDREIEEQEKLATMTPEQRLILSKRNQAKEKAAALKDVQELLKNMDEPSDTEEP